MATKFTADYVLKMLKEIKKQCDKGSFDSKAFSLVYPSFQHFRPLLNKQGFFSKKKKVYRICRKITWNFANGISIDYRAKIQNNAERFQQKKLKKNQESVSIEGSDSISLDALVKYSDNLKLKTEQKSEQKTEQKSEQKTEQETEQKSEKKTLDSSTIIDCLAKENISLFKRNKLLNSQLKTKDETINRLMSKKDDLIEKSSAEKMLEHNLDLIKKLKLKSEIIIKLEEEKEELNKIIKELRGVILDVTEDKKSDTEKENLEFRACCKNNIQLKPIKKTIRIFGITVVTIKVSENV